MSIQEWLKKTIKDLEKCHIGTARLDALVLLEDTIGKERSWLLAHPEYELTSLQVSKLAKQIKQRQKHIPLAFIRGKTEFYGREFALNQNVLEPRPESETMIELLKEKIFRSQKSEVRTIVDVGTGSGAIGITAKLEWPEVKVIGTDIDPNCIKLARQNARNYEVEMKFYQGDLLEPLPHSSFFVPHSILLANLPYVPDHYQINEAAMMEPRIAIFGGSDGLDLYRRMFKQISNLDWQPSYIFSESLPFQHNDLSKIASQYRFTQQIEDDFIQVFVPNA